MSGDAVQEPAGYEPDWDKVFDVKTTGDDMHDKLYFIHTFCPDPINRIAGAGMVLLAVDIEKSDLDPEQVFDLQMRARNIIMVARSTFPEGRRRAACLEADDRIVRFISNFQAADSHPAEHKAPGS